MYKNPFCKEFSLQNGFLCFDNFLQTVIFGIIFCISAYSQQKKAYFSEKNEFFNFSFREKNVPKALPYLHKKTFFQRLGVKDFSTGGGKLHYWIYENISFTGNMQHESFNKLFEKEKKDLTVKIGISVLLSKKRRNR